MGNRDSSPDLGCTHSYLSSNRSLGNLSLLWKWKKPSIPFPPSSIPPLETYADSFDELRTRLSHQGDLIPHQVRAFLSTVIARWSIPHRILPVKARERNDTDCGGLWGIVVTSMSV